MSTRSALARVDDDAPLMDRDHALALVRHWSGRPINTGNDVETLRKAWALARAAAWRAEARMAYHRLATAGTVLQVVVP